MKQNYRIKFLDNVSAFNGNTYRKDHFYDLPMFEAQSFVVEQVAVYADEDRPLSIEEFCNAPAPTKKVKTSKTDK